jgi:pimeloyl-ACP methyl ester carboxylesterase
VTDGSHGRPGAGLSIRWGLALSCLLVLACGPAAAKKVDVGGHRLHVVQKGKGTPTVVFDSGLGDSLNSWRWVWPDVAKLTSVVLYDRAGLGRSDPGPGPRASERIARELHSLLEASGASGPYVLVGHSFGGLNLRLFTSLYPDEVAGLVLIEATPVDFPMREQERRSQLERAKLGTVLALGPSAMRYEMESIERSAEQVREAGSLPEVPIVVLSSVRPEESAPFRSMWLNMQKEMALRLSARRHVVAERSGHYVQSDEPQLVVDAIRQLVELAR